MYQTDALRALHRLIDARVEQVLEDRALEYVRGTVTDVIPNLRTVSVRLDGATTATPNIRYPAHAVPVVGDDVIVVRRRRDGLLLVLAIL